MRAELYEANPHIGYLDPIAIKDDLFRRGLSMQATPMLLLYDNAISRDVSQLLRPS